MTQAHYTLLIHSSYSDEVGGVIGGLSGHTHGWRRYLGQVEGDGWMRRREA